MKGRYCNLLKVGEAVAYELFMGNYDGTPDEFDAFLQFERWDDAMESANLFEARWPHNRHLVARCHRARGTALARQGSSNDAGAAFGRAQRAAHHLNLAFTEALVLREHIASVPTTTDARGLLVRLGAAVKRLCLPPSAYAPILGPAIDVGAAVRQADAEG